MNYPYEGLHLWIWELDHTLGGDLQAIIQMGRNLSLSGWIVKAHDGVDVWDQFVKIVKPLQRAGFVVGAWGYLYGDDPIGEARAAEAALNAGADCYVADAEAEYVGKPQAAVQFGQALRARYPHISLGYAPFAEPNLHPGFPYTEFSHFCNVCLPQIYWADSKMDVSVAVKTAYEQLKPLGLPIAPIGQAYGAATAADIRLFGNLVKQENSEGVSFWDVQSANAMQLQALKSLSKLSKASASSSLSARGNSSGTYLRSPMPLDVSNHAWYFAAVRDLIQLGIVTAYQDGLFKPDEPITRAQAADWLNRLRVHLENKPK